MIATHKKDLRDTMRIATLAHIKRCPPSECLWVIVRACR